MSGEALDPTADAAPASAPAQATATYPAAITTAVTVLEPGLDGPPENRARGARVLAGLAAALGGGLGLVWLVGGVGWWLLVHPLVEFEVWLGHAAAGAIGLGGVGLLLGAFRVWNGLENSGADIVFGLRGMVRGGAFAGLPGAVLGLSLLRRSVQTGGLTALGADGTTTLHLAVVLVLPAAFAVVVAAGAWAVRPQRGALMDATAATPSRLRRTAGWTVAVLSAGALLACAFWPGTWTFGADARSASGQSIEELRRTLRSYQRSGDPRADVLTVREWAASATDLIACLEAELGVVRRPAAEALRPYLQGVARTGTAPYIHLRERLDLSALAWGIQQHGHAAAAAVQPLRRLARQGSAQDARAALEALGAVDATGCTSEVFFDLAVRTDDGCWAHPDQDLALVALARIGVRGRPFLPAGWKTEFARLVEHRNVDVRVRAAVARFRLEPDEAGREALAALVARELTLPADPITGPVWTAIEGLANGQPDLLRDLLSMLVLSGREGADLLVPASEWVCSARLSTRSAKSLVAGLASREDGTRRRAYRVVDGVPGLAKWLSGWIENRIAGDPTEAFAVQLARAAQEIRKPIW